MIDQKVRELIHGELDNSNTPSETQELKQLIAADPKVAAYFQELKELGNAFKTNADIEPPKELKADIMDRILAEKTGTYTKPIPVWTLLREKLTVKQTFVFATGLAAGLAFFFIFSGHAPSLQDGSNLYGTLASVDNSKQFKTITEQDIHVGGASAHLITRFGNGVSMVELSVTESSDVELGVDFDPTALSFIGFGQTTPSSNAFSLTDGTIHFKHTGTGRYTFLFDTKGTNAGNVLIRITQNGVSAVNSFPIK